MTVYRPIQKSAATMSLACLEGRRLAEIVVPDEPQWAWFFRFDGGTQLTACGLWRVVGRTRVEVARDDHQQLFGLPEPVDARRRVLAAIADTAVTAAAFDPVTGDLRIEFGSGARLEALTDSSGYESWQLHRPDGIVLVGGGGGEVWPSAPDREDRSSGAQPG